MLHISAVSIIGAGNVGTHLALALHRAGVRIHQVCSRSEEHALHLCKEVEAKYVSQFNDLDSGIDALFLIIPDRALRDLPIPVKFKEKLLVHTSGSTDLSVLSEHSTSYGVFYPLQTFSKERKIDFTHVPVCIEANTPEVEYLLRELAGRLSDDVQLINSEQRRLLHLSAVISSNFSNYMYVMAEKLLVNKGMSFDMLAPLITETALKAALLGPAESQTGPAIRNDKDTIRKHIEMLREHPSWLEIYKVITQQIIHDYNTLTPDHK